MKFNSFEEIISLKKAKELSFMIYKAIQNCRDYSFRDQIQRATLSIMNNIAEGFERKGNKEFKQFLFIAKGSCAELRSMIHLALDLNYIKKDLYRELLNRSLVISRMLSALITTL